MTEAEAPAGDPKDPYADSVFIVHKVGETDPFLSIFCLNPEEAKSKIDRIVSGEEVQEVRKGPSAEDPEREATPRPAEMYLLINTSQWVLIDTIEKALARTPIEKFSSFVEAAKNIASSIEEYHGYNIYTSQFPVIREKIGDVVEAHRLIDAVNIVQPALLMAFVGSCDSFMSEFLKAAILASSEPLVYSDRKLTLREVIAADSIETLKNDIIDDEVEQVLRESHAKQVEYIKKCCHFDPFENYPRKEQYLELFERRNLVAHGIGTFNDSYKKNMASHGFPPKNEGQQVRVVPTYLRAALNVLAEFALLLEFASSVKRAAPDDVHKAVDELNARCVDFISSGRAELAKWILKFLAVFKKEGFGEYAKKTVTINLANAQFITGENEAAEATLKMYDWNASADEFQICEVSIRGDAVRAAEMLPRFADEKKITRANIRAWPAFSRVRDEEVFRAQFQAIFGEPLFDVEVQNILSSRNSTGDGSASNAGE